ncbi:MAG TPA: DUF167 domain-containing protein [Candidatus Poseidoniales archaeon]|nr:DUF167 domain-containing protein [Candidatus Poseidoniales archaeon]
MVVVEVWIRPSSTEDQIHGFDSWTNRLVISVRAPPISGKANRSLIALLASTLEIPKNRVRIIRGATSRKKQVEILGLEEIEFPELLGMGDDV